MKRWPSSPQPGCAHDCANQRRVDATDIPRLSPRIRNAIIELKEAFAQDPGIMHVQVTFDDVAVRDNPPTLDVIATWYHWEPGQDRPPAHPGGERHLKRVE